MVKPGQDGNLWKTDVIASLREHIRIRPSPGIEVPDHCLKHLVWDSSVRGSMISPPGAGDLLVLHQWAYQSNLEENVTQPKWGRKWSSGSCLAVCRPCRLPLPGRTISSTSPPGITLPQTCFLVNCQHLLQIVILGVTVQKKHQEERIFWSLLL